MKKLYLFAMLLMTMLVFSQLASANLVTDLILSEITGRLVASSQSSSACTDTDQGKDYLNIGTTTVCKGTTGDTAEDASTQTCVTSTDACIDANHLSENYCLGSRSRTLRYTCKNGCSEGACIPYTCENLPNRTSRYFTRCSANALNEGACFNKITGAFQRCTKAGGANCIGTEKLAAKNLNCPLTTPDACTDEYIPVCGQPTMPTCSEGMGCIDMMPRPQTYGNMCKLEAAGATFIHEGDCELTCAQNSDCPVLTCIQAPCPEYVCLNGKCEINPCLPAGQGGNPSLGPNDPSYGKTCCPGLTMNLPAAAYDDKCAPTGFAGGGYICTDCGNEACDTGENKCTCPADCSAPTSCTDSDSTSNSTYTKDYSGNGNDGIVYGATLSSTGGKVGGAYNFNGNGDYINIGDLLDTTQTSFTVEAWVKPSNDVINTWQKVIIGDRITASAFDLYQGNNSHFGFVVWSTGEVANTSYTHYGSPNVWYHLAGVYNKDELSIILYLDGTPGNKIHLNNPIQNNVGPMYIGANIFGAVRSFNGTIDEVKIYNYALTQAQVQADYQAGLNGNSVTPNPTPVLYLPFDGGLNYYMKGTASGPNNPSATDFCMTYSDVGVLNYEQMKSKGGNDAIIEHYCDIYGNVANEPYACPFGCSDGACQKSAGGVCTETDGGKNYYLKGTLTFNNREVYTDFCNSQGNLNEMYCVFTNTGYTSAEYACPFGCSEGACNECATTSNCMQPTCENPQAPCPGMVCVKGKCVAEEPACVEGATRLTDYVDGAYYGAERCINGVWTKV